MKISFEKKIFLGFMINVLVVLFSIFIFARRLDKQRDQSWDLALNWVGFFLFVLSILLLTIVYFIIRTQFRAKTISQTLLYENRQLLQSIIDNTSNPIYIKKTNGAYLLINKQYELLFHKSNTEIIGKTDYDFLPKNIADTYRNSDFEVIKALKELKTEEIIEQSDGTHTYIAVKFPLYDTEGEIYAIGGIATDITERKKTEESLKSFGKFFNMSIDIMIIASKESFITINPAMSKMLGYEEAEIVRQPLLKYVYPDDLEFTKQEIEKLKISALNIQFENRWICKDGSIKWLIWSASQDTTTDLIYGVARDVTVQKEIQKSLLTADKFFNLSYDMLVVAKGDYIIKINPAFKINLGYELKDVNNIPFISFSHPDDIKASIEAFNKLKRGESIVNHRMRGRCKDGTYKWLDWTSTSDIQTGMMYSVVRDVTEIIANENSLKMADLFFNMSFDILTVSKNDYFIKVNPAFTEALGYQQSEVDKIKFIELIHPDDKKSANELLDKLLKGEPKVNLKYRMLCKNGSYKWIEWHSNYDPQEGILYSAAHDITEQMKMEVEQQVAIDELYENEEKLRLILENISEGIIVANVDKKIILANDMANAFFGTKDDTEISPNLINHFEIYYPDEKTIFPSQNLPMYRALKGETTNDIDLVLWDPNTHEKRRVLIGGKPLMDQNNQVVAAVVTIKDISKYKQLEEELKESESKYRQLIGYKKSSDLED